MYLKEAVENTLKEFGLQGAVSTEKAMAILRSALVKIEMEVPQSKIRQYSSLPLSAHWRRYVDRANEGCIIRTDTERIFLDMSVPVSNKGKRESIDISEIPSQTLGHLIDYAIELHNEKLDREGK